MFADRLEVPAWECFKLLASTPVGRLCVIDHGTPIAFPINFRVVTRPDGSDVVVRTDPGTALGSSVGAASMEVDHIDLHGGDAWSVIVRGSLQSVYGTHDLPDPLPSIAGRSQWRTMAVSAVSGRRLRVSRADDGYSVDWQIVQPG